LSVSELHEAIDVIGKLFSRYSTLFTAVGWSRLEREFRHDWKAVFREPWIRQSD
jgi:hypothetical protein